MGAHGAGMLERAEAHAQDNTGCCGLWGERITCEGAQARWASRCLCWDGKFHLVVFRGMKRQQYALVRASRVNKRLDRELMVGDGSAQAWCLPLSIEIMPIEIM